MIGKFMTKLRDWLPRRGAETARAQAGAVGLELDVVRGVVHRARGRPFAAVKPDSARCIPSRGRHADLA